MFRATTRARNTAGLIGAQHAIGTRQGIGQAAHRRRCDRQRPARRTGVQAQVKLALPGGQPLPRHRLQQLQFDVIAGRADVLYIARTVMAGPGDLHRRGT
jgi:hypothetical protein